MRNINRKYLFWAFIVVLVLLNVRSYGDLGDWFIEEILTLPGILLGLSIHEFGHAAASNALGDPTPKNQGRLTVNPLAHTDWIGFFCLIFAGFGWGIPVQIDPSYYKHPRRDEFIVSIAGVAMNFLTAVVFAFLMHFMIASGVTLTSGVGASNIWSILLDIFRHVVLINIVLMVFNLIPVPPLDGFGILTQILDLRKYNWYYTVYQNGFIILMLLIVFDVVGYILNPAASAIWNWMVQAIIL